MKALLAPPSCLLPQRQAYPWRPIFPNHSSYFLVPCATRQRPWDSNAETIRSPKFNFTSRGRDDPDAEDEEDEDDDDDLGIGFASRGKNRRRWWSDEPSSEVDEEPAGIFGEIIDSVWIFKIFRSYGWALPPIIFSLLLSTGPKAFLMALALPLGQSVLSLAFEKLWGSSTENRSKRRKPRMRKKPFPSAKAENNTEKQDENQEKTQGKMGYKSWVDANNNGSVNKSSGSAPKFGGWDDLDRAGYTRGQSSGVRGRNQKTKTESGKLSRREGKGDAPLLLRLLIAVFPFLGSWTKML